MNYYDKLRPYTDFEVCRCATRDALLLVHTLTDNPIHCYACKGEVDPEAAELTESQVDSVAAWHEQFRALYALWLDSGAYEDWAKKQLLRRSGQVNRDGLKASADLAQLIPTYYWWFHDTDDPLPSKCPACRRRLGAAVRHGERQCNACRVII